MLLDRVLQIARERGMNAVTGSISAINAKENADEGRDLIGWYRKAGAEILPSTDPRRIAVIRFKL